MCSVSCLACSDKNAKENLLSTCLRASYVYHFALNVEAHVFYAKKSEFLAIRYIGTLFDYSISHLIFHIPKDIHLTKSVEEEKTVWLLINWAMPAMWIGWIVKQVK